MEFRRVLFRSIRSRSQSQLLKCGSVLERAPPLSRSIILNYRKKVVLTGVPIGAARAPDTRQYRHNNQRLCFREAWHHSDADRQFSVSKRSETRCVGKESFSQCITRW